MFNSNQSGLRIAEEVVGSPKTLPGTPIWEPCEPNSYGDFGGEVKTEARSPIAADRQRRKGTVTDLDASAGFQTDFTTRSLLSTIQGFMFASWRKKTELTPTAVAAGAYTVAANGTNFPVGSLVFAEGYTTAINNGMKKVTASTGTSVSAAGLLVEATATGTITRVGVEGASGDLTLTLVNGKLQLNATALNLTTLGLIPGEWVWLGGDAVGEKFATAASNGFYRVYSVAAGVAVFDRWPDGAAADAGTGKTIRVFFGQVLKNEADPALQVIRTYQAERTLTSAADKIEYVSGLAANELKLTSKVASKLIAELNFKGLDATTATALKTGTRPALKPQVAYNSSGDYARLRVTNDVDGSAFVTYITDLEVSVDNGVDVDKAVGYLGGVSHSLGDFQVSAEVEAFFSSTAAVDAVKANTTASLDFAAVSNVNTTGVGNQAVGWLFDLPALQLGDARLKVEKDKKIKLPLKGSGFAHDVFNHSLLLVNFQYLPQLAI
jgi:hypothetical protein